MPNYCSNYIEMIGDPKDVKELYDRINLYMGENQDGYRGGTFHTML